jgi:hypothetical protein
MTIGFFLSGGNGKFPIQSGNLPMEAPLVVCSYMKLHIVGTVNRLNVEHRTSNIERPLLWRYALSILRQANRRISNIEPQNVECRMSKDGIASLRLFLDR